MTEIVQGAKILRECKKALAFSRKMWYHLQ